MTFSIVGRCARHRHAGGRHHHLRDRRRRPLSLGARRGRCGLHPERHRPHLGPTVLDLLAGGKSAAEALQAVLAAANMPTTARSPSSIARADGTSQRCQDPGDKCGRRGKGLPGRGQSPGQDRCTEGDGTRASPATPICILPSACCGRWRAGSRRAVRKARSNLPGCWSWTNRSGPWSTCGSTGRRTIRSRACATSGSIPAADAGLCHPRPRPPLGAGLRGAGRSVVALSSSSRSAAPQLEGMPQAACDVLPVTGRRLA